MRRALFFTFLVSTAFAAAVNACGDDSPGGVVTTADAAADGAVLGTDASQSVPAPTTEGPIDPSVAARVAVIYNTCVGEFEADKDLERMYSRTPPPHDDLRRFAACIDSKKNGCAAVKECMGFTVDLTGPCKARCDGTVYEACDDEGKYRLDCPVRGLVCAETDGGVGCVPPGAAACTEDPKRCDNNRPVECNRGSEQTNVDCTTLGLSCEQGVCRGNNGACTTGFGPGFDIDVRGTACEGDKLKACVNDGFTTWDCGRNILGATCQARPSGGETEFYCGFGTECRPGAPPQGTCDGDSVVVCNGGRIERVDCKALGFERCIGITSRRPYAFCGPSPKEDAFRFHDALGGP